MLIHDDECSVSFDLTDQPTDLFIIYLWFACLEREVCIVQSNMGLNNQKKLLIWACWHRRHLKGGGHVPLMFQGGGHKLLCPLEILGKILVPQRSTRVFGTTFELREVSKWTMKPIMAPTSHYSTLAMEVFNGNDRSTWVSRLKIVELIKIKLGTIDDVLRFMLYFKIHGNRFRGFVSQI